MGENGIVLKGVISAFLLGLYTYAITLVAFRQTGEPPTQVTTVLNVVGGLVSAVVIALLALPQEGNPVLSFFRVESLQSWKDILGWAYVLTWTIAGSVMVIRWLRIDTPSSALATAASSWLGLAAAAAYAYFGLRPK